jgi:hypothetical protein
LNETADVESAKPVARSAGSARVERGRTPAAAAVSTAIAGAQSDPTPVRAIAPDTLVLSEFKFQNHFAVAQPGTRPEDLDMNEEAFAFLVPKLSMFDNIRIASPDEAWIADLVVVDHGPTFALCRLVNVIERPARASPCARSTWVIRLAWWVLRCGS